VDAAPAELRLAPGSNPETKGLNCMAEAQIIANQKSILKNQKAILANQETIKKNLGTIKGNQVTIKKNQEKLDLILKNQERILALIQK
jgi:hypothetical protein